MKKKNKNDFHDISELFRTVLRHYIDMQKESKFKSNLVKELNDKGIKISFSNFSNFLNNKTSLSERKRAGVAEHLGFRYEEFLLLGRKLIELENTKSLEEVRNEALYLNDSAVGIFKELQKRYELSDRDISGFLRMDFVDYQFRIKGFIHFTFDDIATVFEKIGGIYPDFNNPIKREVLKNKNFPKIVEKIKKMSAIEKEVIKTLLEDGKEENP